MNVPPQPKQPPLASGGDADIPFQRGENARQSLGRISARLAPVVSASLPNLLAEAPDPDSAVFSLERLINELPADFLRLMQKQPALVHYAILVFGHSRYLGETLFRNPDLLQRLCQERALDRSLSREEFVESWNRYRMQAGGVDLSQSLARFKRREYVRILLRDVLKIAPLAETTAEISALADVLIEAAWYEADARLRHKYGPLHPPGEPGAEPPFAVLSLGKLGGNELNYDSDVDLLYLFGNEDDAGGAKLSHHEYFIRLAQEITTILSQTTRDGAVFRIDLRLRPQGKEGELALSLNHALHYYAETAQDWERQALIKVRRSAGDGSLAREFIRGVQPYVYSAEVNFRAVKTALMAREKMHLRPPQRDETAATIDVKLDYGGIRDIEFLVQCLQRIYGGREPWLRSGGTLASLQKLHDKEHLSSKEFHELTSTYEFLRHVEHRLQLRDGRQTHRLPSSDTELRILLRSLLPYDSEFRMEEIEPEVRRRMAVVVEIYDRIVFQQSGKGREQGGVEFVLDVPLEFAGFSPSNQQILERLARDAPALHTLASNPDLAGPARRNLFRFLNAAFTSSGRYADLIRRPEAVAYAMELFDNSEYLTEILLRYPEEIATLESARRASLPPAGETLFEAEKHAFAVPGEPSTPSDAVFSYLTTSLQSATERFVLLRRHYRHRILSEGVRDYSQKRNVYASLASLSGIADEALAAAAAIAGAPLEMAIMALGRLGTREFDILSDVDLLFICDERVDRGAAARAAERIMNALGAYTRDGLIFPVDVRLRPRGGEGELVVSAQQLLVYCQNEAQPWEALTYTKLRFVAGAPFVAEQATRAVQALFARYAGEDCLAGEVRQMRARLETEEWNFKASPGGTYDIDFLTGYLVIRHGIAAKPGNLRDRLWRCAEAGALTRERAAALDHAAELLRTAEHITRMVAGRAHRWLPTSEYERAAVEQITAEILGEQFHDSLERELIQRCVGVRRIFEETVQ